MPDIRIVDADQNNSLGIAAAGIHRGIRANALKIVQVNVSGDIVNPGGAGGSGGDGAINDGADSALKATVKNYANAKPLAVVLVNVSGDAYNSSGGGAASNINIDQVGGNATSVNAGNADNGTLRIVIATDQTAFPVTATFTPPVTGVQIVGGGVNRVSISGDVLSVRQSGAWATAVTGDVSTTPKVGNVWPVQQSGAWAVAGTGDFSTTPKAGNTWPVREQGIVGVQIVGGGSGISGDAGVVARPGSYADPRGPIGVQVVGYSGTTATQGVSGDVSVKPATTIPGSFHPVSGDTGIRDGADPTVKATVRDYTNSNPLAVVQTNTSGDPMGEPTVPLIQTVCGRLANQGSNSIVAAVTGKRIKVTGYELQGDGDNARGYFSSGASGAGLSVEWELASREGVVRDASGGRDRGFLFATTAGAALSFEATSSRGMKYSVSYQVEDAN